MTTLSCVFARATLAPALLALTLLPLAAGCVTRAEEKEIRRDIFDLQTRMIRFEQVYEKQTGDTAMKRLAAASSEFDRVHNEIAKLNGELDAIRQGVQTGRLPGQPDTPDSVASRLKGIEEKFATIQEAQEQILAMLEKGGGASSSPRPSTRPEASSGSANNSSSSSPNDTTIRTFTGMKQAFARNNFAAIADNGARVISNQKGRDKDEATFMYAESLFRTGHTLDAVLQFNNYLEAKNTRRDRVPHVKMRIGDCFRAQGDPGTARIYYQEVIKEFPSSSEAKRSRERLSELSPSNSPSGGAN
jgi:TolA-binding protein